MFILRFIFNTISVFIAALAGNWFGEQVHSWATGEPAREMHIVHTNKEGETMIVINPRLSNFIPALLASLFARPHWLWAFIGGVFASVILGNRYEKEFSKILTGEE